MKGVHRCPMGGGGGIDGGGGRNVFMGAGVGPGGVVLIQKGPESNKLRALRCIALASVGRRSQIEQCQDNSRFGFGYNWTLVMCARERTNERKSEAKGGYLKLLQNTIMGNLSEFFY